MTNIFANEADASVKTRTYVDFETRAPQNMERALITLFSYYYPTINIKNSC